MTKIKLVLYMYLTFHHSTITIIQIFTQGATNMSQLTFVLRLFDESICQLIDELTIK